MSFQYEWNFTFILKFVKNVFFLMLSLFMYIVSSVHATFTFRMTYLQRYFMISFSSMTNVLFCSANGSFVQEMSFWIHFIYLHTPFSNIVTTIFLNRSNFIMNIPTDIAKYIMNVRVQYVTIRILIGSNCTRPVTRVVLMEWTCKVPLLPEMLPSNGSLCRQFNRVGIQNAHTATTTNKTC